MIKMLYKTRILIRNVEKTLKEIQVTLDEAIAETKMVEDEVVLFGMVWEKVKEKDKERKDSKKSRSHLFPPLLSFISVLLAGYFFYYYFKTQKKRAIGKPKIKR